MTIQRKRSELLSEQAAEEDNDFKALALHTQSIRESRLERFEEKLLPLLQEKFQVYERKNGSYTIDETKFGAIDYFPKANKLLIRKSNKWKTAGMKWMRENLLNDEKKTDKPA